MSAISTGMIARLADGNMALVLGVPDAEGYVRTIPVTRQLTDVAHALCLQETDFVEGSATGWLRLNRQSWMVLSGATVEARLSDATLGRVHRALCVNEARDYAAVAFDTQSFVPGVSTIPPSGKVIGARELELLVEASLDGWLTSGRFNTLFERQLGRYLGRRHVLTTNSGSSANLLALSALTSTLLGERALRAGDEIITVAAGFPTTVNPALQHGLVPVFVDVCLPTYNIDVSKLADALSPRTRAIMIAHTLGNPFDLDAVMEFATRNNLWVIEDCCDALGSLYKGRKVGGFGHIGTLSFYPAHHITMGEGGAVFTDDPLLKRALESIRDWGRDCYCAPGKDNTCRKRFQWQLGDLPMGYDHKYTYSHLGYNLKITDMQAAVGVAQLERLEGFIATRRENFAYLHTHLAELTPYLVLPEATSGSEPSWFGFPLTLTEAYSGQREALVKYLNQAQIGTRLLFAGNLTRQPYFKDRLYRVSGTLDITDRVMRDTLWLGIYPGITPGMLDFVADTVVKFFKAAR